MSVTISVSEGDSSADDTPANDSPKGISTQLNLASLSSQSFDSLPETCPTPGSVEMCPTPGSSTSQTDDNSSVSSTNSALDSNNPSFGLNPKGKHYLIGGTLKTITCYVVFHFPHEFYSMTTKPTLMDQRALIMGYREFFTAEQLLDSIVLYCKALVEKNVPDPFELGEAAEKISQVQGLRSASSSSLNNLEAKYEEASVYQLRAVDFLDMWMLVAPLDLSSFGRAYGKILEFVTENSDAETIQRFKLKLIRNRAVSRVAPRSGSAIGLSGSGVKQTRFGISKSASTGVMPKTTLLGKSGSSNAISTKSKSSRKEKSLLRLSSSVLSTHLNQYGWQPFLKVEPSEFIKNAWNKKNKDEIAPNLSRLAKQFNQISFWVATSIVRESSAKKRAKLIKFFIKVAVNLRQMSDFNSLMQVLSGMNNSSVQRLKKTWQQLSHKYHEQFDMLDELMDPRRSYATYKLALSRIEPNHSCFPYLAPILRDLTFANDGNPAYLDAEKSRINYQKIQIVGSSIYKVLRYTSNPHQFNTDEKVLAQLDQVTWCVDDDLHALSMQREPPASGVLPSISDEINVADILNDPALQGKKTTQSATSANDDDDDVRSTASQDPEDPSNWDCEQVLRWLSDVQCNSSKEVLKRHAVNGKKLLTLDARELQKLGLMRLGPRKRLAKEISRLKAHRQIMATKRAECKRVSAAPAASSSQTAPTKRKDQSSPENWAPRHVQAWIRSLDYDDLTSLFSDVDGPRLLKIDTAQQLSDLGINKLGVRKRILKALAILKEVGHSGSYSFKSLNQWTTQDVGRWMESEGFGEHVSEFLSNGIDGPVLSELYDNDLILLGVLQLGRRKTFRRKVSLVRKHYNNSGVVLKNASELSSNNSGGASSSSSSSSMLTTSALRTRRRSIYSRPGDTSDDDFALSSDSGSDLSSSDGSSLSSDDEFNSNWITFKCFYQSEYKMLKLQLPVTAYRLRRRITREFERGIRFKTSSNQYISTDDDLQEILQNNPMLVELYLEKKL